MKTEVTIKVDKDIKEASEKLFKSFGFKGASNNSIY